YFVTGGAGLCLFHKFTGVKCPGCGLSRAWVALLQGRILRALSLNPLMLIFSLLFTLHMVLPVLFRIQISYEISGREQRFILAIGLILLLLNWLYIVLPA
ncbi:MAG TPA: DUF2752 domain-containing protein, partial [Candidatus Cloacimonadota bacterium]|nr:DUF2752 domain-containing protein [Candidatus Cloacimonadota bacterium]